MSALAGVQGSLYLLVLTINSSIAVVRGLAEGPGEMPIWGGLAAMTTAATLLLLGNAGGRAVEIPVRNAEISSPAPDDTPRR